MNTPVFHPQKTEKVTVVLDCASKLKGTSLNDQLLQSLDLTTGLLGVVIRFCQEPVAMVVDVEGMFHHVWVVGGQTMISPKSQLITKYQCTHLEPRLLQVARVFVLKKTDLDNLDKFDEETINTVNRNLYVDDCLESVPTTDKVARLSGQFRELLSRGGF